MTKHPEGIYFSLFQSELTYCCMVAYGHCSWSLRHLALCYEKNGREAQASHTWKYHVINIASSIWSSELLYLVNANPKWLCPTGPLRFTHDLVTDYRTLHRLWLLENLLIEKINRCQLNLPIIRYRYEMCFRCIIF